MPLARQVYQPIGECGKDLLGLDLDGSYRIGLIDSLKVRRMEITKSQAKQTNKSRRAIHHWSTDPNGFEGYVFLILKAPLERGLGTEIALEKTLETISVF